VLAFIEGVVAHHPGEGRVVIKVGDFGVLVDMVPREANSLRYGERVKLHTELILNAQDGKLTCYGFLDVNTREVFRLLKKGHGVGPKVALALLDVGTARLVRAIEEDQAALLTGVPGVGAKTAQRLVVEMKGRFAEVMEKLPDAEVAVGPQAEVTQALVGLGFRESEVHSVLANLSAEGVDLAEAPLEELLRVALERLRR
jgi:Holliday junction DNA helicase RuvA